MESARQFKLFLATSDGYMNDAERIDSDYVRT
jgi:hypothetical protein